MNNDKEAAVALLSDYVQNNPTTRGLSLMGDVLAGDGEIEKAQNIISGPCRRILLLCRPFSVWLKRTV
jgi:hypothetical protein